MHTVSDTIRRTSTGFVATVMLGLFLLGVTPAVAGIGGSDVPTWPVTASVGDLIGTSVVIINESTDPNNVENVTLTTLFVTPACADSAASICLSPNEDPGIFKVLTAIGDAGTAPCADIAFTIGVPNPTTGEVALTPVTTVTLGPANGPEAARTCQVDLLLRVFAVPANPAPGPDFTTNALTRATLHGVDSGLDGAAGGSAQITISKGIASITTTSNPSATTVAPGTSVTDTAIVKHAPGAIAPTGSVRFILCQPGEVNANGCPGGTGTKVGNDIALVGNSATSDPTSDTNAIGKYCWRGRYLGDANYEPTNETNATTECFTTLASCDIALDKTCAVALPATAFVCRDGKPIQSLTMQWTGAAPIFIRGVAGITPFDIGPISPGGVVTVSGYDGSQGNNVVWNIFDETGTTNIGQSSFHLSCSDENMNGPEDCGKPEGDNKGNVTCRLLDNSVTPCVNLWLLEGMAGQGQTLECSAGGAFGPPAQNCQIPPGGATVQYSYKVTNNNSAPVNDVTVTDDKLGPIGGPVTVGANATVTFMKTAVVDSTTTNTATASGNGGQCTATDSVAAVTPCDIRYPFTSPNPLTSVVFNESEVLRTFEPNFAGPGGIVKLFYNDEHALSLGVKQISVKTGGGTTVTDYTVAPLSASAVPLVTCVASPVLICHATTPPVGATDLVGDQAGTDPAGRPLFPALFITDLTINGPDSLAGDWQFGGTPIPPSDVFGTWKAAKKLVDQTKVPTAVSLTVDADPAKNNWNLGPGSDTPAGGFAGLTNQGFGSEVRWNVDDLRVNTITGTGTTDPLGPNVVMLSSLAGHTFRVQFMVHDGDQNKSGGDVGQNCMTVAIP